MAVKDIASKLGEQWRALSDAQKEVGTFDASSLCPVSLISFLRPTRRRLMPLSINLPSTVTFVCKQCAQVRIK
jgi:hypothetical protein